MQPESNRTGLDHPGSGRVTRTRFTRAVSGWGMTLEDYGALLCLPHLRAYIPAFDGDVATLVPHLFAIDHPAYLRLGLSEEPKGLVLPPYAPWRKLLHGGGSTLVVVGPLVGGILEAVRHLEEVQRPNVWLVSELPLTPLPEAFLSDLARSQRLVVVEEHVAQGGQELR